MSDETLASGAIYAYDTNPLSDFPSNRVNLLVN